MDSTALVANDNANVAENKRAHCERLADEISTLSSYLYAAEHRLLTLIR